MSSTDYEFPEDWGLRTPEQKSQWYVQERNYRQARRQFEAGLFGDRVGDVGRPVGGLLPMPHSPYRVR